MWPSASASASAPSSACTRAVASSSRRRGSRSSVSGTPDRPRAREDAATEPLDLGRRLPARLVPREVGSRHRHALDRGQKLGDRALVDAVGALVGEQLERRREPGLLERLARLEQAARRRVDALAVRLHREDGPEHREAGGVGGRHRHALARQPQRRLDDPRPGQAAVAPVERAEPAREARERRTSPARPRSGRAPRRREPAARPAARPRPRARRRSSRGSTPPRRRSRSRGRRRAARSSPSRRRTRRGRPRRRRPRPSRPPRGSRSRPPRWPGGRLRRR